MLVFKEGNGDVHKLWNAKRVNYRKGSETRDAKSKIATLANEIK